MSDNKKKAILSSAVLLFVLSLVNKGLGFIKSMTIASVFGATIQTDAYYVAEGLMQNALIPISEAVAVSFLPIYITIKEKNKEEAHKFTSRTITDIFLLALVLSGILYVVAPVLLKSPVTFVSFPSTESTTSGTVAAYWRSTFTVKVNGSCQLTVATPAGTVL